MVRGLLAGESADPYIGQQLRDEFWVKAKFAGVRAGPPPAPPAVADAGRRGARGRGRGHSMFGREGRWLRAPLTRAARQEDAYLACHGQGFRLDTKRLTLEAS